MAQFNPPKRLLMGPGPSDSHPRVLSALAKPVIGHLDKEFLRLMNEIQQSLRTLFGTTNQLTIPVSGTGSSGMEAVFVNLVQPGDKIIIGVNGVFGGRMVDVASRCGGQVITVDAPWGEALDPEAIRQAAKDNPDAKFLALVHAETSTGVLQDMDPIAEIARKQDLFLILDAVTSLGGVPVKLDEWGVDACYSGTQKCLSCPPGLSPVSFSERAVNLIQNRTTKVQSWYLDMNMVAGYWTDGNRAYHHTAPINMNYALHEALELVFEEGTENRFKRHKAMSARLWAGLSKLGLSPFVDESCRLPQLNSVKIPEGINEAEIRAKLLDEYQIEIGAGLGPLAGKIWRVGLMGDSCTKTHVDALLAALTECLG